MLMPALSILFGLGLLVWSADRFVIGAASLARKVAELKGTAVRDAEKEAKKVIGLAIARLASEVSAEATVSVSRTPAAWAIPITRVSSDSRPERTTTDGGGDSRRRLSSCARSTCLRREPARSSCWCAHRR